MSMELLVIYLTGAVVISLAVGVMGVARGEEAAVIVGSLWWPLFAAFAAPVLALYAVILLGRLVGRMVRGEA